MAIPTHKIGDKQFLRLDGLPCGLSEQVEVIMRPGVDDVAIWVSGNRGKPFTVRSLVDAATVDDARGVFESYLTMKRQQHAMQWADYDFLNEAFEVLVLDVQPARPQHIAARKTIVGGLNVDDGDDGFFLYCDWTLIETSP